jgi:predicted signal transduction protein with EAL and GGDEF domain
MANIALQSQLRFKLLLHSHCPMNDDVLPRKRSRFKRSKGKLIGTPERDELTGTPKRRKVYGLAGDDLISAKAGKYRVWGGEGIDTFITVNDGKGHMKIMDMEPGEVIEFCGCPLTRIEQRGNDAWIVKVDDVKAVVANVNAEELQLDYALRQITLVADPLA